MPAPAEKEMRSLNKHSGSLSHVDMQYIDFVSVRGKEGAGEASMGYDGDCLPYASALPD